MSDRGRGPEDRRPPPTLIWLLLAVVAVALFAFAMWALNPPQAGMGRPTPDVILPTPKPGSAKP